MTTGARHARQRRNRVILKADCVALLDRLVREVNMTGDHLDAIADVRWRLRTGSVRKDGTKR